MAIETIEWLEAYQRALESPGFRVGDEYQLEVGLAAVSKPNGVVVLQAGHLSDPQFGPRVEFSSKPNDHKRVVLLNRLHELERALTSDNHGGQKEARLSVDSGRNERVEFRGDLAWDLVKLELTGGLAEVTVTGMDVYGYVVSNTITYVAEKSPNTYMAVVALVEYVEKSGLNQSRGLS